MPTTPYSPALKGLTVTLVLLEVGLYSISVAGWPSLVYIFRDSGFYSDLCVFNSTVDSGASTEKENEHNQNHCSAQEEILNLVFTVAVSAQILMPTLGYFYDHFGLLCVRLVSIVLSVGGCLLMAFSEPGLEWLLFPGATLHLFGGNMLMTSDMQLASLFPTKKSTIGALVSGAADMSSFSFLLVKLAYDAGFPYRLSFIAMGCGTFIIATATSIVLPPREAVPDKSEEGKGIGNVGHSGCLVPGSAPSDAEAVKKTNNSGEFGVSPSYDNKALEADSEIGRYIHQEWGAHNDMPSDDPANLTRLATLWKTVQTEGNLKQPCLSVAVISVQHQPSAKGVGPSGAELVGLGVDEPIPKESKTNIEPTSVEEYIPFSSVLKSPMFWLTELWFSCSFLILNAYFGSFNALLEYRSNGDLNAISHYTNVFGYLQLASSVPLALVAGHLVDMQHSGRAEPKVFIGCFVVTCVSGLLLWVTCAVPILEIQYVSMLLHCTLRTFTFGAHITFIAYAFPRQHFGKTYSVQRAITTLIGALQFPLFFWLKSDLDSDPLYFSLALCGISCLMLSLPVYLMRRGGALQKEHNEGDMKKT
ncbi:solute carrier family 43 member 3-like [Lingula anatina]|uniref:Solute carrier family 43 member 3-like n=1 Tax=Lingula anatina TaxID=7574 RepID=A0A1S3JK52_LINAN|nr:solute carrier family 43 member 3-like [Lingula anatina]|eukprot:XP_013410800.1 solute carrier family 43 member 3-like [Lingula anatina]